MAAGLINQFFLIGWLWPKQPSPGAVLVFISKEKTKAAPGAILNKVVLRLIAVASRIKPAPI